MLHRLICAALLLAGFTLQAGTPIIDWVILGPMGIEEDGTTVPSMEAQKAFFAADQVDPGVAPQPGQAAPFGQARLVWNTVQASEDGTVDLDAILGSSDYAAAYAYSEYESQRSQTFTLGIGSNDAVRVWVNGEEVHTWWGNRSLRVNQDLVTISVKEGINRILLKVQNMSYDWGFAVQNLAENDFSGLLPIAAGHGDLDAVEDLLNRGASPNATSGPGMTAWQFARIRGRRETADLLASKGADTTLPMPDPRELVTWYLENELPNDEPGAAILISRQGNVLFEGAFGKADLASGRNLTSNSTFRIGSVTKQFTAMAILQLREMGKLSLDQTLDTWYPDVANAESITVHQLLTHTAGVHSYTEEPGFGENLTEYMPAKKMEKAIAGYNMDFAPGTSWLYSNSGYFLLGRIVERVSGSSLYAFWQEYFFTPFDMTRSSSYDNRLKIKRFDEAIGYSYTSDGYDQALDWDMSWAAGAGVISSTVTDLDRWANALFAGQVLPLPVIQEATTSVQVQGEEANAFGSGYGYGLMMGVYRDQKTIGHSGGLHGFISQLLHFPALDMNVVVLMNASPRKTASPIELATSMAEMFAWESFAPQASYRTMAEELPLEDYLGRYAYPGGIILTVTEEDGKLMGQLSGQSKFELFPKEPDHFFWKVVEASIRFVRDGEGKVTGGLHQQGGQELEVGRIVENEAMALSPETLDRLTGTYDMRGMDMVISRRDNTLWALMPGQPEVELFASSETEFFLRVVQANVVFTLGDKKSATSLTLTQGATVIVAQRKN